MLTEDQVRSWREEGYVVVRQGVNVDAELLELEQKYPPNAAEEDIYRNFPTGSDQAAFPNESMNAFNSMCVDKDLVKGVAQLLGTEDIRLTQAVAWGKYGVPEGVVLQEVDNNDQRIHMDYGNHTWVHPPRWNKPNVVAAIVYLSDTTETGGATAVVARRGGVDEYTDPIYTWPYKHMPGISPGQMKYVNNRELAEEYMKEKAPESYAIRLQCYEREVIPAFQKGDVLFYRHDVWHRGTPVSPSKVRYVHNFVWCTGGACASGGMQHWNEAFTMNMYNGWLEEFLCCLTDPLQLVSLGFPGANDAYWEEEHNVEAVRMRYGERVLNVLLGER